MFNLRDVNALRIQSLALLLLPELLKNAYCLSVAGDRKNKTDFRRSHFFYHLSSKLVELTGIEPVTPSLQS